MKALDAGLYTQLSTPATTLYGLVSARVYDRLMPPGGAFPCVVFNQQAGGDTNQTPLDIAELVYLVKAIATSQSSANSVDEAIRARLHNMAFTVSGWSLASCMRTTEAHLEEIVNGAPVFHVGALYRIRLTK